MLTNSILSAIIELIVTLFQIQFDIKKVNNRPSRLQHFELEDCNKLEIQRQLDDPILAEQLVEEARQLIKNAFPERYRLSRKTLIQYLS